MARMCIFTTLPDSTEIAVNPLLVRVAIAEPDGTTIVFDGHHSTKVKGTLKEVMRILDDARSAKET